MRKLICFSTCVNQTCCCDYLTIKVKVHWCLFCKNVYGSINWFPDQDLVQHTGYCTRCSYSHSSHKNFFHSRIGIKRSFFNFQSQPLKTIACDAIPSSIPSSPISQDLISIYRMPLDPLVEGGGPPRFLKNTWHAFTANYFAFTFLLSPVTLFTTQLKT